MQWVPRVVHPCRRKTVGGITLGLGTWSRSSGTTASACRSTPSGWSAGASCGLRRRMAAWRSPARNWPTCWTGSTGGTRSGPGGLRSSDNAPRLSISAGFGTRAVIRFTTCRPSRTSRPTTSPRCAPRSRLRSWRGRRPRRERPVPRRWWRISSCSSPSSSMTASAPRRSAAAS